MEKTEYVFKFNLAPSCCAAWSTVVEPTNNWIRGTRAATSRRYSFGQPPAEWSMWVSSFLLSFFFLFFWAPLVWPWHAYPLHLYHNYPSLPHPLACCSLGLVHPFNDHSVLLGYDVDHRIIVKAISSGTWCHSHTMTTEVRLPSSEYQWTDNKWCSLVIEPWIVHRTHSGLPQLISSATTTQPTPQDPGDIQGQKTDLIHVNHSCPCCLSLDCHTCHLLPFSK